MAMFEFGNLRSFGEIHIVKKVGVAEMPHKST